MEVQADCYWNASTDGQLIVRFDAGSYFVIMTLYGCAL